MNLCKTILGSEDIGFLSATPQDWYDTYKVDMQIMVDKNGLDWVQKHVPKGSLILA